MAARSTKIRHDEDTRKKIQAAQIINRFQKCINGEIELDAQQVSCGKALLNKILPDLKAVDVSGEMDFKLPPMQISFVAPNKPLPKADEDDDCVE